MRNLISLVRAISELLRAIEATSPTKLCLAAIIFACVVWLVRKP